MVKLKKSAVKRKPDWFLKSSFYPKSSWGFMPKNWRGSLSLVLLVGLNIFAANYFKVTEDLLDALLKFGVVFCLSIFVFIEIAKYKTEGVRRPIYK
ncbi:MAG: hypothetical protein IH845_02890 [Nanoarchaeota archaeon]|nr:hypothetical protein [Nanoarchaeota archaeon]